MIFTDLNLIEEPCERLGEAGPGTEPRAGEQPEQPRETAGDTTMTMNWKRTGTANGAGAHALHAGACVRLVPGRRIVRALRWKQDAVCRDAAADADSTDSSLTRTFFLNPLSNSTDNPKGTPNTTQKKKGKQTTKQVTISQEPRNLSLTTKEKKLWHN